ncbi:MAG: hypothetical protein SD837_21700 [Candidatus Electrothrix scaldis]|nr:MAG: hypothetical protein SD837_21700 [Candidatus Electrothrix sp. GW3-3]
MTEQEALDSIPDDWAKDISPAELKERTNAMWPSVVRGLAEERGVRISPSDTTDKIISKLARQQRRSKANILQSLRDTCLQNSKIDIFTEKYGHLFTQDKHGELSYSLPMLRKITGLDL